jgi:tRNA threonylcarbamoyladenosine modification (KEOPS) complex Cgi121 subunit
LGIACLKVKDFRFKEMGINYFVGISQIKFDEIQFLKTNNINNEETALEYLFDMIEELQNKNKDSIIQFVKDDYLLNQDHMFLACYYMQKAFLQKTSISHKKNIELLLYLSTHRQISKSIKAFGIDENDLKEGRLTVCITSPFNNLEEVHNEILQILNATELELTINDIKIEKINKIIKNYNISNEQIESVLKSYGIQEINTQKSNINLEDLTLAIFDIICEKMALLSLE